MAPSDGFADAQSRLAAYSRARIGHISDAASSCRTDSCCAPPAGLPPWFASPQASSVVKIPVNNDNVALLSPESQQMLTAYTIH